MAAKDAAEIDAEDAAIDSDFAISAFPVASVAAEAMASDFAVAIAVFLFVVSDKIEDDINEDTASIALWFVKYLFDPSVIEDVVNAANAADSSASIDIESGN